MGRPHKTPYFIDNAEFEHEIIVCQELGHPESARLGQMLVELHEGVFHSMPFKDYPVEVKQ